VHRRPLGRGRLLAAAAAAVLIAGCLLPWYSLGGDGDLPLTELRALDGSGILVFLAALGVLALLALPYAASDRPLALDRWPSFLVLTIVAAVGLGYWPIDLLSGGLSGMSPTSAPGWWIAALGVILLARATYDIWREPERA
jgi:hypothetical protein